jgi:predicted transcriptional regulator
MPVKPGPRNNDATRQVVLRVNTQLWDRFQTLAEIDDRSANRLAVRLIRDYVNARDEEQNLADKALIAARFALDSDLAAATATKTQNRRKQ